jgi:hypothetical protein
MSLPIPGIGSGVTPLAPPEKPPPADDSCSVCYFSEQDDNGIWRCCYNPPGWQRSGGTLGPPDALNAAGTLINWPIVDADDWCGHGYNTINSAWMNPANAPLA